MRKRYQLLILLSVLLIIFVTYCAKKADEVPVAIPLDSMLQIPLMPAGHFTAYCSSCHGTGAAGVPQWPAETHGRFNDNLCTYCHKEAGVASGTPPSQPTVGGPPLIPAGHSASNCSACHSAGLAGAPQWPATHVNFTENMCTGCHQTTPVAPGTPPSQPPAGPPLIPAGHSTSNCSACHSAGLAGAPQWPATHVNFAENMCTGCHQTTPVAPGAPPPQPSAVPPLIPAAHYQIECSSCHTFGWGAPGTGAPRWPDNHLGFTKDMCLSCHQQKPKLLWTPVVPPPIPFEPATGYHYQYSNCIDCHKSGKATIPVLPTNHLVYPPGFEFCIRCHPHAGAEVPSMPPRIPAGHNTSGCATCHSSGTNGAPKWPWYHANTTSYTERLCSSCHQR